MTTLVLVASVVLLDAVHATLLPFVHHDPGSFHGVFLCTFQTWRMAHSWVVLCVTCAHQTAAHDESQSDVSYPTSLQTARPTHDIDVIIATGVSNWELLLS